MHAVIDSSSDVSNWADVADDVAATIATTADEHDRRGDFVSDAFDLLRRTSLVAAPIPSELGGGGASHAETCAILRTLGRSCGSTAVTLSMHYHLVCTQVWRHHHGLSAEEVLRRAAGDRLVLVSTGASDWVASSGSAVETEGGFRVTARKSPASGCPAGDIAVTSIRWDDAPSGPQVIHCSIPFAADGVSIDETWDAHGLRATGSHTVVFDDVFVPESAVSLVRPADVWHPVWNVVLPTALPLIMSAYLGIADRAVDEARSVAVAKVGPAHLPSQVGAMLNHHAVAEDAVAAMIERADDLRFDNTDDAAAGVLTRKTIAADAVEATVRAAVEVVGGMAFSRHHPLERMVRDVAGARFHPLPAAKQAEFCGRVALGLDPVGQAI